MFDTPALAILIWSVLGYLVGSVPFGIVITRTLGLGDLRKVGSGNIGATNVLRTGHKGAAAATLLLDGAKGAAAVLLARWLGPEGAAQWAGLAAFVGHCYPAWLRFKGGKGVATYLGVVLALAWPVGLLCCATWAFAVAVTRISSVGALTAAASTIIWMFFMGRFDLMVIGTLLTAVIYLRHKDNLARLRAGTEPRIGRTPPPPPEA
ncbi:glycerol-3-phosphate 1-O-acyltransferase PlsY [Pseudoponticoccus marisrubri]|uniref:Glycerol-3-phosphate acyltransferase n=1 Tax=Pseudoponticoccus marisrubri TaxID=1685382 RepID=A0A0W7WGN9_9RHOB|nr:glycerol-3-phosphate 1-O-acyltransferase PlsY [Pseudoponticoccus marisrubri]KUF09737.1 glycerol-3-phosphate acyltransferase [Pseudoponticoccus marisrubri]